MAFLSITVCFYGQGIVARCGDDDVKTGGVTAVVTGADANRSTGDRSTTNVVAYVSGDNARHSVGEVGSEASLPGRLLFAKLVNGLDLPVVGSEVIEHHDIRCQSEDSVTQPFKTGHACFQCRVGANGKGIGNHVTIRVG